MYASNLFMLGCMQGKQQINKNNIKFDTFGNFFSSLKQKEFFKAAFSISFIKLHLIKKLITKFNNLRLYTY